jgi:hypothetical protein
MSLGSEVEIVLGLEKDSKSGFLYRCNVVGVKPVK